MGLTPEAKDIALSSLFLDRPLTIGLTRQGREITDAGYKRAKITFSSFRGSGEGRSVSNVEDIRFGPWRTNASAIPEWFVVSGSTVLVTGEFSSSRTPQEGDEVVIRKEALVIGLQ